MLNTREFKRLTPDRFDWMLLATIWILGGYFIVNSFLMKYSMETALSNYAILVLVNTPMILFNVFVLIPNFFKLRWIVLYFVLFLLSIAFFFPIENWLTEYFTPELCRNSDFPSYRRLMRYTMESGQQIAIFSSFFIAKQYLQYKNRVDKIEKEKVKTELDFLKAQINPHFYFNTLNNLYGLALLKSDKAPDAILKLSEIMEYVIYDARTEKVVLDKEIEYLRNYIELEKLRLETDAKVHFELVGETAGLEIAPLLLLPFIENAFKHGANTTQDSVDISIRIEANAETKVLELLVQNKFEEIATKKGLGIQNLKKRLALIYPNQFEIEQGAQHDIYTAKLVLNL